MQINVETSKQECVTAYIKLINTLVEKDSRLTKGEIEILTDIILKDDATRKRHDRAVMLLDYKTVKEPIMFNRNISQARLFNVISSLKKKKVLSQEETGYLLSPVYQINPDKTFTFTMQWDIQAESSTDS